MIPRQQQHYSKFAIFCHCQPVWPDWANFEISWQQIYNQSSQNVRWLFWASVKTIAFKVKLVRLHFRQLLQKLGLLFISTSCHTVWDTSNFGYKLKFINECKYVKFTQAMQRPSFIALVHGDPLTHCPLRHLRVLALQVVPLALVHPHLEAVLVAHVVCDRFRFSSAQFHGQDPWPRLETSVRLQGSLMLVNFLLAIKNKKE